MSAPKSPARSSRSSFCADCARCRDGDGSIAVGVDVDVGPDDGVLVGLREDGAFGPDIVFTNCLVVQIPAFLIGVCEGVLSARVVGWPNWNLLTS